MKKSSFVLFAALGALVIACGGEKLTPNGYKYTIHTKAGGPKAEVGNYAFVHISVFQDDSLVNSTYQMGRTVPIKVPNQDSLPADQRGVGKANPVADVLAFMSVGDSATVEIPIDSMMRQNPQLKDAKSLVYGIVVADIKTKEQYDQYVLDERKAIDEKMNVVKEREAAVATQLSDLVKQYAKGALKDKLKTTATGLKYLILEEGTGEQAAAGKKVDVQYYGMLPSGEEFDNSFKRGQPYSFPLGQGQVIKGWDEGIALLKVGSKAVLFIPSELAYGSTPNGKIPANSELYFYVELEKVQ